MLVPCFLNRKLCTSTKKKLNIVSAGLLYSLSVISLFITSWINSLHGRVLKGYFEVSDSV